MKVKVYTQCQFKYLMLYDNKKWFTPHLRRGVMQLTKWKHKHCEDYLITYPSSVSALYTVNHFTCVFVLAGDAVD